jgi:hypothetical protein
MKKRWRGELDEREMRTRAKCMWCDISASNARLIALSSREVSEQAVPAGIAGEIQKVSPESSGSSLQGAYHAGCDGAHMVMCRESLQGSGQW